MLGREIEKKREALQAFIKRAGHIEELGQYEQKKFDEMVERCEGLTYGEKANLKDKFSFMLTEL